MYRLSLAFLCLAFTLPAAAQDSSFTTKAPHVVIMDFATGEVLFEKDAREPMAPASMTKIMTANMIFEALENGTITWIRNLGSARKLGGAAAQLQGLLPCILM